MCFLYVKFASFWYITCFVPNLIPVLPRSHGQMLLSFNTAIIDIALMLYYFNVRLFDIALITAVVVPVTLVAVKRCNVADV